uniref:Uncharacterized protein n=1 Tax=Anopheles atroparvus TaxID=41427 RepID=A0A182IW18_ANOAO
MDISRNSRSSSTAMTDSKMVEIDFKTICRICGKSEENLTSVHSRYQNDLRGKIAKYLSVDIAENDTLPTKICFCCKDIITKWHDLFDKCRVMEQRFAAYLRKCEDQAQVEAAVNRTVESDLKTNDKTNPMESESFADIDKNASGATEEAESPRQDQESKKSTFDTQPELVDHMKDEHWDQIFHCEQCDNYLDRAVLIEHMTMHALSLLQPANGSSGEPEQCSLESESDREEDAPEGELEEAEGSQQTTEMKSGEGSTNKENDEKDAVVPEAAKGVESRKLYCYICEKTLANRSAYSYHVNQVHLNIKKFDCSFCEKKFGNRRLLNNHIANVHSRERNFACTTCEKRFKTNVALYNHMRVHDDKLQFSCRFCDKKFRFRNHLVSHELIHLDERNFACNQCEKKFNTNECLQKHKLTHVTTEPYQCPLCGFSTKQKRYLVMHAKRIHMVR